LDTVCKIKKVHRAFNHQVSNSGRHFLRVEMVERSLRPRLRAFYCICLLMLCLKVKECRATGV